MPIDNNTVNRPGTMLPPDPHGHAALLLTESLIHRLVERSILSTEDAFDIVETADSVQIDVAEAADGAGAPMWRSHALLSSIAESLGQDRPAPATR